MLITKKKTECAINDAGTAVCSGVAQCSTSESFSVECGDKFVLPTGRTHSGARGRVVPNRDLCDTHRPRLCKYSKEIYPNSAVCGRIFTLLDNACRTGGTCCE